MKFTFLLLISLFLNAIAGFSINNYNSLRGGCDPIWVFTIKKDGTREEIKRFDTLTLIPSDTLLFDAYSFCQSGMMPIMWFKDSVRYNRHHNGFKLITTNGFYELKGIGKTDRFKFYVKYDIVLDLKNNTIENKNIFNVFPNPSTGNFHISSGTNLKSFEVYGLDGKVVIKEFVNGSKEKNLSLSHLSPGIYYLKVETEDRRIETKKLMIGK